MSMPAGEVKEMPRDLIYEIIESHGKAARLCKGDRIRYGTGSCGAWMAVFTVPVSGVEPTHR